MMWFARGIFLMAGVAVLGGSVYMSSQGVWGASSGAKSIRGGTYIAGGRVK